MFIVSLVLTLASLILLIICVRRNIAISKNEFVTAELVQVDIASNDSSGIYEATYRYKIGNKTKIFISEHKSRNKNHFDTEIKLYYKDNKQVFEKPSDEILVVSLVSTLFCLTATIIYFSYIIL